MQKKQPGQYPISPNSVDEGFRLSKQDDILNEHFPLLPPGFSGTPRNVLDVACGTGRWLIKVAQEYPDAVCYGLDKSDLLLGHARNSADENNVQIEYTQGDMFDLATLYKEKRFDVIQMRCASWFVGDRKQEVFALCKALLAPGGMFRLIEFEQPYSSNSFALKRYSELFFTALRKRGALYVGSAEFPPMFRRLEFASVQYHSSVINLSANAPHQDMLIADMRSSMYTLGKMIVEEKLVSLEEFEALRQECFQDMASPELGMLAFFLDITGQI